MSILEDTKDMPLFPIDNRGFYHIVMSLILSQRVRFTVGRNIRKRIYELQGTNSLDNIIKLTENEREKVKLPDYKWKIIVAFHNAWTKHEQSNKIPGIGQWTIDSAKIMVGDYSCGFITSDLAVRKWVSQYLKRSSTMTEREIKEYISSLRLSVTESGQLFSKIWNYTQS